MALEPSEADRGEHQAERQTELNRLTISELAYPQLLRDAVEHARRPRPNPPPLAPREWRSVGPRNLGGRILSLVQDENTPLTLFAGSAFGGLWRSLDGGDSWQHVDGQEFITPDLGASWIDNGEADFDCPVGALALHPLRPNVLLLGSGSVTPNYASGRGLYRVRLAPHENRAVFERLANAPDASASPQSSVNGEALRYTRIEFDPEDPDRFWAASQSGLWRGRTSGPAGAHPQVAWVRDFPQAAAPAGFPTLATQALAAGDGAWPAYITDLRVARDPRSADTVALGGRQVARYLILHLAVEAALVGGLSPGGVFRGVYDRQTDTVTWDPAKQVMPVPFDNPSGRILLAICRSQPQNVYAVFDDGSRAASPVHRSVDNGSTWVAGSSIGPLDNNQAEYSMVLEVHPDNPLIIVCGTLNISLSTDGATNFRVILDWHNYDLGDQTQHADQHVVMFDRQNRRKLWVGNDGGLSAASDIDRPGAAPGYWRKRSHGIVAGQFQDVSVHPSATFAGASGGGLQDNGSWISYGGPTWYRVGWADGGALAWHGGQIRQFLATQNGSCNLTTVDQPVAPGTDRLLVNPVIPEYPDGRRIMYLRVEGFPFFTLPTGYSGPFVGLIEQDPRSDHQGQALFAWTAVGGTPLVVNHGRPPAPRGTAPVPPEGVLPAVPGNASVPPAIVNAVALPGTAPARGDQATALAYGPPPAVVPGAVEGWIGSGRGNLYRTTNVSGPPAAVAWQAVTALPVAGGALQTITRFAIHPGTPAMVAVSTIPADTVFLVRISVAGAPGGAARYRVRHFNAGGRGDESAARVVPVGPFQLPGTSVALHFPLANYNAVTANDRWFVAGDGTVTAIGAAPANGLTAVSLARTPVTVRISAAGAVGVARCTFTAGGMAASAAIVTAASVQLPLTGLVVAFSGGPFVLNDSWTIAADGRVTPVGAPGGTLEVLARLHGRVFLSYDRGANWLDISAAALRPAGAFAADSDSLPNSPVTSLRFDTGGAGLSLFAGTLAGVYVITNLPLPAAPPAPGAMTPVWRPFHGTAAAPLPLTLVSDIEMIPGTRVLRVGTFGRGIWDCDLAGGPRHQLSIRQTLFENAHAPTRPFPPPTPDDPRLPAGEVWLDHAHAFDIRVDTAPFDFFDDRVDGVEFDNELGVDDIQPLARQAVYVQVHNNGWDTLADVRVHLLVAPCPAAPQAVRPAVAPAASMPGGMPAPDTLYAPPDFDPSGASPWRRVAAPITVARLRPGEPRVLRFDWTPPASLGAPVPAHAALLALCTAADDPLPAVLAPGTTLAAFIAGERRAALRVVPVRAAPAVRIAIRDGVDDDTRAGSVAFIGRSPDLIVVQAEPAQPAEAFRDLLASRLQDQIRGAANHVYVRVHNRGAIDTEAEVQVWALSLDARGEPSFAPGSWTRLSPAAADPPLRVAVPAAGTALAHLVWNNPPDPTPGDDIKAYALVALIKTVDDVDRLPDTAAITTLDLFWQFFGSAIDAENAALRVLRYVP